ncbi:hypothetical protein ACFFIS_12580 [Virgibacillus soli]|uniref:Uncharacterized protein n=1 Tax=Paracerasibacillus soli TaxID=480284 RepID=A0ABU5CNE3_9BACI|nr:hypothetical protein [Virgibacillus soli]MDY0407878.1 hypothetical protein [Virgibacillus soli]
MATLVVNCFHWIGFHIVNAFLQENEKVIGYDQIDVESKQFLSMYFGRNDKFKLIQTIKEEQFENIIIVGEPNIDIRRLKVKNICVIQTEEKQINQLQDVINLNIPYLIGEWMPLKKDGIFIDGKLYQYDNELLSHEAIYMKDVATMLFHWMKNPLVPATLSIKKGKYSEQCNKKLENSIFIRDNRPNKESVLTLREHYDRYSFYYDSLLEE